MSQSAEQEREKESSMTGHYNTHRSHYHVLCSLVAIFRLVLKVGLPRADKFSSDFLVSVPYGVKCDFLVQKNFPGVVFFSFSFFKKEVWFEIFRDCEYHRLMRRFWRFSGGLREKCPCAIEIEIKIEVLLISRMFFFEFSP